VPKVPSTALGAGLRQELGAGAGDGGGY
jgi:hypothetical protein